MVAVCDTQVVHSNIWSQVNILPPAKLDFKSIQRFICAVGTSHTSDKLLAISNAHTKAHPASPHPTPPNLLVF